MNDPETTYQVNTPTIVHEEIDGEAVIVNMENGSYYSIDGCGALIWTMIEEGMNAKQVLSALSKRFTGSPAAMEEAVAGLIAKFLEEEIIVPKSETGPGVESMPSDHDSGTREPFAPPLLRKYSDMEELLLLDPVYDQEPDERANNGETASAAS